MSVRVLIAAGGTGGHVFPALAIADELRRRGAEVLWLACGGLEMEVVPARGFTLYEVPFRSPRGIGGIFRLLMAVWRARQLIRQLRPAVVLGMGGYAAAPGGLAAKTAAIAMVVHEQNAVAGRANRLLCKTTTNILTGFPAVIPGGQWVGNPVREEFCQQLPPEKRFVGASPPRRLLVLGGSQGAQTLNRQVPAAMALLSDDFVVVHQCGRGNVHAVQNAYLENGRRATVSEFIEDVATAMASADLVICRAGAATLSELAAVGAAAILIPYPFAAANHQYYNARFFVDGGAAFMCSEQQLSAEWLANFLSAMTQPMVVAAAQKAHALSRPKAAATVAEFCLAAAHAS